MSQDFRLDNVGMVNREKKISFKFNGKKYFGFEGDTIASALIANGVHLVGRSFKYHRPRGFFGVGVDEPYAILQLDRNNERDPNIRATEQEIFEGLEVKSVNCWPSVNFDIGAINNFLKMFFPAGFYYKTFMWPPSFWYKIYEPFIRMAAGFGEASIKHDKERYEHKYEYCDLLITGSGPSGLASAYAAAKNGARVILAEDTLERQQVASQVGLVMAMGPQCYKDKERYPEGPWCKEKDWVMFARYAGSRIKIDGGEMRLLNDDEVLATIDSPEDILHEF